jgi:adenosylcobinamide-GDP ribazoletransferase
MNRILATLSFFTRLPFWRLADIPKEAYERVVPLWPLAGWVTALAMAATMQLGFYIFHDNIMLSCIFALLVRILITGALHEDGFADFCDGFGGGTTRERTLEIMKDSHIGTYGVIGLTFYFLIMTTTMSAVISKAGVMYNTPTSLPIEQWNDWNVMFIIPCIIFIADVMSKAVSSTIIYSLPYARKEAEAKNKLVYVQATLTDKILTLLVSLVPCAVMLIFIFPRAIGLFAFALLMTIVARFLLVWYMRKRIQGYTGDCCGAMFIICECVFYLTLLVMSN